jgi:hypothetical protein
MIDAGVSKVVNWQPEQGLSNASTVVEIGTGTSNIWSNCDKRPETEGENTLQAASVLHDEHDVR